MAVSRTNTITSHRVTLMPPSPSQPQAFGWIQLKNGEADAGYIYLTSPPVVPHLSFDKDYIVTSMPMSELTTILDILRREKELQIRFHDNEVAELSPSVFIEVKVENAQFDDALGVPSNVANEVRAFNYQSTTN